MLGTILAFCVLLWILIQIPLVQDFAKDQTVIWLNGKLNTKVAIGKLRVNFPTQILIEKVYLEDQHRDSLLWGNKISIDIALFKLLQNKIEVKSVKLDEITLNIKRLNRDTVFNFNYIIQTFASDTQKETVVFYEEFRFKTCSSTLTFL